MKFSEDIVHAKIPHEDIWRWLLDFLCKKRKGHWTRNYQDVKETVFSWKLFWKKSITGRWMSSVSDHNFSIIRTRENS